MTGNGIYQQNNFYSPTYGSMTLTHLRRKALDFMEQEPGYRYNLIIGTDSQPKNGHGVDFVTAVVIHRVGFGGIYFWKRIIDGKKYVLKTRIYQEAALSLTCAQEILEVLKNDGYTKYDIEIHVDIGSNGETKEMINEVVGMIRGSGFPVKTKPLSYGASKVADRHT
ncbi:hypothetical protein A3J20_06905 [Candidatus Gottesmanbacteria bacterium RIFCSPLOWO2_02_FULL_42_29]|uniref:DUF458 domain-containing protein n=2 Tax=Candidatus Gottesmaniibacteriota TaxID=1752720 RepID=A0A1F6BJH2_9BACT|nr:MAG: hypothetical protein UV09_C0012G0041 [Candidatus Gottesmanbacteria bacterium GW2011_GWA2_42_18]OGG10966.1 MAG: hypothetical protein A2781_01285 [Candidatus Gottesmanbacteria bacterium RIFCSPHIGHO2_01_FULL_42_27]OGG22265.1 MAG: hypothetical protein A3E72_03100 [Candidatus Gottesmanbacteria bacterium RIFCSPHIGHO2_12_FULL_43_26]OGG33222.1 MAG: hypothetical protein A3G68_07110 [Candidatus Gottesmanbacteria bacterium RIFCSPLOWO2_12_FULL_42_10]OGG37086.1 MAG: hypothetical protein A2968_01415 